MVRIDILENSNNSKMSPETPKTQKSQKFKNSFKETSNEKCSKNKL